MGLRTLKHGRKQGKSTYLLNKRGIWRKATIEVLSNEPEKTTDPKINRIMKLGGKHQREENLQKKLRSLKGNHQK